MKLVLVTIKKDGPKPMNYPKAYSATEVEGSKVGKLVYEGRIPRGEAQSKMLVCLQDVVADRYALDPDMEIVTQAQADAWLGLNPDLAEQPEEQVTDAPRLQAIDLKQRMIDAGHLDSAVITQEDLDALDPDKATPGINRKKKTATAIFDMVKAEDWS